MQMGLQNPAYRSVLHFSCTLLGVIPMLSVDIQHLLDVPIA
jgi:hypothetical protein